MLKDILQRIDERLAAMGLTESKASKMAGLSDSAIRNMRRAVKQGKEQGASIKTLDKLAPVLDTTSAWLLSGGEFVSAAMLNRLTAQLQLLPMDELEDMDSRDIDDLAHTFSALVTEKLRRQGH